MRPRKSRIQRPRPLERLCGLAGVGQVAPRHVLLTQRQTTKIGLIGVDRSGARRQHRPQAGRLQDRSERARDIEGDLLLDGDDVLGLLVVGLGPEVGPVGGEDQIDPDTQPPVRAPDAAFQDMCGGKTPRDVGRGLFGRAKAHGHTLGHDPQIGRPREAGEDLLGQTVGKPLLIARLGLVAERQHHDRLVRRRRAARTKRDRDAHRARPESARSQRPRHESAPRRPTSCDDPAAAVHVIGRGDGPHEAIALPVHRTDDGGIACVVSNDPAEILHRGGQHAFADVAFPPDRIQQLTLRTQRLRGLHQLAQQGERVGADRGGLAVHPQALVHEVQAQAAAQPIACAHGCAAAGQALRIGTVRRGRMP